MDFHSVRAYLLVLSKMFVVLFSSVLGFLARFLGAFFGFNRLKNTEGDKADSADSSLVSLLSLPLVLLLLTIQIIDCFSLLFKPAALMQQPRFTAHHLPFRYKPFKTQVQ